MIGMSIKRISVLNLCHVLKPVYLFRCVLVISVCFAVVDINAFASNPGQHRMGAIQNDYGKINLA